MIIVGVKYIMELGGAAGLARGSYAVSHASFTYLALYVQVGFNAVNYRCAHVLLRNYRLQHTI